MKVLGSNGRHRVEIDVERILRSRLLITAMSGGGKSWAMRRILEQTHGDVQHIIIDPEGEFYTLREKFDYLIAGADGDVRVSVRHAKMLAKKVLQTKVSVIVDLSDHSLGEKRRYVAAFLDGLMFHSRKIQSTAFVVIDEAHKFAPEKGQSESRDAVVDLMSAGRKRGLAGILATQRLSKLHKDAAAEAGSVLVGLSTIDIDVRRAADLLGFATAKDRYRIRRLSNDGGEFFFIGPAWKAKTPIDGTDMPVKVGPVRTTHPKAGRSAPARTAAPDRIATLVSEMQKIPEAAEEEIQAIEDAKIKIAELTRELRRVKKSADGRDMGTVNRLRAQHKREIEIARANGVREGIDRVRNLIAGDFKLLAKSEIDLIQSNSNSLRRPVSREAAAGTKEGFRENRETDCRLLMATHSTDSNVPDPPQRSTSGTAIQPARATGESPDSESRKRLDGSSRRVLDAMAWLESMGIDPPWPRRQVAFVASYRPTSGGFRNILSKLKTAGLIEYPSMGTVAMTTEGRRLGRADDATDPEAIRKKALDLCDRPMARVLSVLIDEWPTALPRDEIAIRSGYEITSGGFRNILSKLRTAGFIDYPQQGFAAADSALFPDAEHAQDAL